MMEPELPFYIVIAGDWNSSSRLTSRATVQGIRLVFDSTSIERNAEARHSCWSRDTFLVTEQTVVELKASRDACK